MSSKSALIPEISRWAAIVMVVVIVLSWSCSCEGGERSRIILLTDSVHSGDDVELVVHLPAATESIASWSVESGEPYGIIRDGRLEDNESVERVSFVCHSDLSFSIALVLSGYQGEPTYVESVRVNVQPKSFEPLLNSIVTVLIGTLVAVGGFVVQSVSRDWLKHRQLRRLTSQLLSDKLRKLQKDLSDEEVSVPDWFSPSNDVSLMVVGTESPFREIIEEAEGIVVDANADAITRAETVSLLGALVARLPSG